MCKWFLITYVVSECEDEDTFVTEIEKFKVQQESQPPSQISNPPINEVVWNFNEENLGK